MQIVNSRERTLIDLMDKTIKENPGYDGYVCLQVNSPLRTKQHVEEAIQVFEHSRCDYLYSVTREHHFLWDHECEPIIYENANRQDRPCYYKANGAIFIFRSLERRTFEPYIMDAWESIDVHDETDMAVCEHLMWKKMIASSG